jgi:hypothetical protein
MASSSTQTVQLPEREPELLETVRPLPQPETRETPFVIKLSTAIPV